MSRLDPSQSAEGKTTTKYKSKSHCSHCLINPDELYETLAEYSEPDMLVRFIISMASIPDSVKDWSQELAPIPFLLQA